MTSHESIVRNGYLSSPDYPAPQTPQKIKKEIEIALKHLQTD